MLNWRNLNRTDSRYIEETLLAMIREFTGDLAEQQFYKILKLSIWKGQNIGWSNNVFSVADENILRTLLTSANKQQLIN
jgi:hypothetical protein